MLKLNSELSELVGAFIGDGYLSKYGKNRIVVGITGNAVLDEEYLKIHLVSIVKKYFPSTKPSFCYRKDENTLQVRFYSQELATFFLSLGFTPGIKTRTIIIPKIIEADNKLLYATIRGIFDTDGCLFFDCRKKYRNPYPRITIQMASIPLINQLEKHLSRDFSLYVDKSNRDGKRNTLEIYGHQQLERFLKQIGFSNKRHMSKVPS
ncbi:MAG: LAGLIDADG family homing endonuclease [Nanoarchaeota archaeon]